jgi:xylulokinase
MAYLGIDLGTSSVKVLLVDAGGRVIAEAVETYPILSPQPGAAEQNPGDWWDAAGRATRRVLRESAESIDAIGLSGQMHGAVCLGPDLELLRPAIIWADTRGAGTASQLTDAISRERLGEAVGTTLAAGFQAVTLAWLREHEPAVWTDLRWVLLPKDYLRLRMTGEIASEPSDAASTGMLGVADRQWSRDVLAAIGLPADRVPPLVGSASEAGRLTDEAAAQLGVPHGTPVVAGGGDAPLAALAAGVSDNRSLLATLSSGAQVIAMVDEPIVDAGLRLHTFASPLDPALGEPGWYLMGATMVAGLALRWLRDNVYEDQSEHAIEAMTADAAGCKPGASGLVFAPYLAGERTPHLDPNARGMLIGLTLDHGRAEVTRAVMEGVVFAMRDALDVVRESAPGERRLVLAGGGARSPLWRQLVADIFETPVHPSTVADQSAVGAAVLAAAWHQGARAGEIGRAWATFDDTVEPQPDALETYRELREVYRSLYAAHKDDFATLGRIAPA